MLFISLIQWEIDQIVFPAILLRIWDRSKMFSLAWLSLLFGQSIISGARFFAKAVSQNEIYLVLVENHTIYTISAFQRDRDGKNYNRFLQEWSNSFVLYGPDGKGQDACTCSCTNEWGGSIHDTIESEFWEYSFLSRYWGERITVFLRQLSCHPSSSFVVKVRYSYGAPESLNFIRMNFIKGTVVQIPIRYYNKDKNKEHHLLLFRLEWDKWIYN